MLKSKPIYPLPMFFVLLFACLGCSRGEYEQTDNSTQSIASERIVANKPEKNSLPPTSPISFQEEQHVSPIKQGITIKEVTSENEKNTEAVALQELIDRAKKLEVNYYTSERINLWSDLPAQDVAQLLPYCDQLLNSLDQYFAGSPLKELNQARVFTGFLIREREKFKALDFMPKGTVTSEHGTYFQDKFWVSDQPTDYYRRHLVFHELVHAYMNVRPNNWPEAYQEGMAEFFATHLINSAERDAAKAIKFQVFPRKFTDHPGWTRLQTIQQECRSQKSLTLLQIVDLSDQSFPNNLTAYSWSWAWAYFLANHPITKVEFLELATPQSRENFRQKFLAICGDNLTHLELEWQIFSQQVTAGSQYPNSLIELPMGELKDVSEHEFVQEIQASPGWQQTSWQVTAGQEYEITAEGEVILDTVPADWISRPNGVGLRYSLNQPLGVLQLALYTKVETNVQLDATDFLKPVKVGNRLIYKPNQDGQLYFRVNDFWTEIWNNKGSYRVKMKKQ